MNTKFVQQLREVFKWIDSHIVVIILLAILFWTYFLFGILGPAILFTLLVIGWGIARAFVIASEKIKERPAKKPVQPSMKLEEERKEVAATLFDKTKRRKLLPGFNITKIKAGVKIVAYTFLILFFAGIFLYNSDLLTEASLKIIGVISAVFYISLRIFGIENNETVDAVLDKWARHPVIQKPKSIFGHYFSFISLLNIYLFPIIVIVALAITIIAGLGIVSGYLVQNIILLYLVSIALLIINAYTVETRKGFLNSVSKRGAVLKTLVYIFVPVYLIVMLLISKSVVLVSDYVISLLLIIGSLWMIYKDPLYRRVSLPTIKQSGEAFVGSYFRYLFRYGIVLFVIVAAYFSGIYFRDHDLKDLFRPGAEITVSPFADLPLEHWAFPAVYHLYENAIIATDIDGFIHPAKVLDAPETLSLLYKYFDVQLEDFEDEPPVSFVYISAWDEDYPVFKTAYSLGLVGRYVDPEQTATKSFAVNVIGTLDGWSQEDAPKNHITEAYERGIINSADPIDLNQPLNTAALAQMLYNLHENKN